MAREPKYGTTLNGWQRLLTSMEANPQDFQQLEAYRAQLQTKLDAARQAATEQAAMAAAKQDATKRLNDLLVEGRKLVTFLRGGVKQRYGDKSEKLVEFDLAPARPKAKSSTDATKPPAPPPPTPHPTTA
jgi:paraquat-inducible protein B